MRAVGELVLVVLQVVHEHLVIVAVVVGQLERKRRTLNSGGDEKARKREEGREI